MHNMQDLFDDGPEYNPEPLDEDPPAEDDDDADFTVAYHGSVCHVLPVSDWGTQHLHDIAQEDWQWWGKAVVVEPRYLQGFLDALEGDGAVIA